MKQTHHLPKAMALAIICALAAPAAASPRDDQSVAREALSNGALLPLASIVAMVQRQAPYSRMTFLGGGDFNERSRTYRLKFMDGKRVVFVDVDARTGRIVGSAR